MHNRSASILAAIAAGGILCTAALADVGAGQPLTSGDARQETAQQHTQAGGAEFKAVSSLSGLPVENRQGEEIGRIDQVLADVGEGRLAFVVLSSTAAGTGDQKYIVPWQLIRTGDRQDRLGLDISSLNQLRPIAAGEAIGQTASRRSGREIFQFYGLSPYWEEGSPQRPDDAMHRQMMEGMPHDQMHQMMERMPDDQMHQQMMERMQQPERQPIPPTR